MTDGHGRTVDFKNTILIMTSNLGSQLIMELGEENREEMKRRVEDIMHQQFRPEFLNRIDEIITFHGLSKDDLSRIVDIQFKHLEARLADQKFEVELTDAARDFIITAGYDPAFGARPLKRAIQRHIQNGLAMEILDGTFVPGDRIRVDVDADKYRLQFNKAGVC